VDHLLRFLPRIVVVIKLYIDARALRAALVGVIGDIFRQGRIADGPIEAVALAHAERPDRVVIVVAGELVGPDAPGAVEAVIAPEQPVEQRAAILADHTGTRTLAAPETRNLL